MPLHSHYQVKNRSLPDVAARVISDIANPLIIPPFVYFLIGLMVNLPSYKLGLLLGIALVFYTALPGMAALNLTYRNTEETLDFPERRSRTALYGLSIASAFLGSLLVIGLIDNPYVGLIAVIFFINLIGGFIINFSLKISVHTSSLATGGTCLLLAGYLNQPAYPAVVAGVFTVGVILPLMFWARYRLDVHTVYELLGGTGMGILITGILFYLFIFV